MIRARQAVVENARTSPLAFFVSRTNASSANDTYKQLL